METDKTTIIKRKVNYMKEQSINGCDNNGKIYGIYYYEVHDDDVDTEDQFNSDIIHVEWFEKESKRNEMFMSTIYIIN
jgi:hypothetical protein